MIAFVTLKSRFSQIPEQTRVMVKCDTHSELVDTISKMVDMAINDLNKTQMLGADPIVLNSFDMKRISKHGEDLHYEVIYRIQMNLDM